MNTPKTVALAVLFGVAHLLPLVAAAQGRPVAAPPPVAVKFIDMDALLVTGAGARPQVTLVDARQRAKFDRLLRLKHEVVGALRSTARDATLR